MIRKAAALGSLLAVVVAVVPMLGGSGVSAARPFVVGRVHEEWQPEKGKIFILIVGNDARHGNPDASRADAIHLVGVNTKTMRGGILNIPRDSWVTIPGSGSGRINEALYRGGPELLARTVESITGIRIDYWMMTGFEGFTAAIRELSGVFMTIPRDIYDPTGSGANLEAGRQRLGGAASLAFVRTRHSFPHGDIDRTTNQGKFLLALLKKFRGDIDKNPSSLLKWMSVAQRHTRFDVSAEEMLRLGVLATQMKPGDIGNVTLPVSFGAVGAASVVFIRPEANGIYDRFRANGSL